MQNKIAIVTGGSRGIGLPIAKGLQELGYLVAVIHKHDVGTVSSGVPSYIPSDLEFIGDVGSDSDVQTFFNKVKEFAAEKKATINVLVNNAGVASAKKFLDLQDFDFEDMFHTNVIGAFLMSREFAKACEQGTNKEIKSHIVNISSVSGLQGFSGHAHYCASKFGLIGMGQVAAKELSKIGIAVNTICPGPTQTDMWTKLDKEYKDNGFMPEEANEDDYSKKLLIKRMGKGEDVAEAVLFLINQSYITGVALPVCGGNILR